MPYVSSIDNENIYYEVLGNDGISLVFIGGWAAPNARVIWKYQLEFASVYRIVLIDLSGYGKSSNGRNIHTMESYGYDVKAVIEKLDLDKVILCGQSMGGAVILETARLIPDRILGLIPIDSSFPNSVATAKNDTEIDNLVKPFEENFIEEITSFLRRVATDRLDPTDQKAWETAFFDMDEKSMVSAFRELCKWDFRNILPEINKPIKCIVADRPHTFPNDEAREQYKEMFDTVFIEGVGHFMYLEDPEKFNKVFIERIRELI